MKRSMMINRKAKLPHIMTRMVGKRSMPPEGHREKTLDNLEVEQPQAEQLRYKT